MRPTLYSSDVSFYFGAFFTSSSFIHLCQAASSTSRRNNNPLNIVWDPAPAPEDGPPGAAGALRDPAYLPAQIGGIVGSYALSLIIVAVLLLLLAKKRREHLNATEEDLEKFAYDFAFSLPEPDVDDCPYPLASQRSPIKNFSHPTPVEEKDPTPYILPSPQSSSTIALGVNALVDQSVVAADREMAQQQLEEMYKYVMEQEDAKQAGVVLEGPPAPILKQAPPPPSSFRQPGILKKGKNKPANLDLGRPESEKTQSRTSSIFSVLKSPRKKAPKGVSISSPIMTPMSGTFPRQDGEEMDSIPPRHYAPAAPPPVPVGQDPYAPRKKNVPMTPITPPDNSPESTMSIDERLEAQLEIKTHSRNPSQAPTEPDPWSAVSDTSVTPLVGLPSSPKPGVTRFPSLPASPKPGTTFNRDIFPSSPKPGATFTRANAPSAVRTGGSLPLRAYEPALASPSAQTTKQTTFERPAPLSPSGLRTPWTGQPVPYTPYQPFSPVIPMTPSLVTKADRKRMRAMQPKTPTMELVQSSDDIW